MTSSQGDLFNETKKRKKPAYRETSRQAWQQMVPSVMGELDRLIVAAIRDAGESGITCEEIEKKISRSHQSVSGNLRHIVERGVVTFNGGYGKTKSGRKARKWVTVCPPGGER